MNRMLRPALMIFLITVGSLSLPLTAKTVSGQPRTTADPHIPIDELEIKLRPLMLDQVKTEVDAWVRLLEEKATEISRAEIAVKYKRHEMDLAGKLEDALVKLDEAKKKAAEPAAEAEKAATSVAEAERAVADIRREVRATVKKVDSDSEIQEIIALARGMAEQREKDRAAEGKAGEQPAKEAKAPQPKGEIDRARARIDAAVEERSRDRADLLEYLTMLRAQQTALIDRVNVVIDAYEKKGAPKEEVAEYRKYVTSVAGVAVDVSDWQATVKTVSGWLVSDEGGLRWAKNITLFVVIVLISMFLARVVARGVQELVSRSRQTSRLLGDFLVVTVRRLVVAIGILIGLAALEINIGPLLAVIGAAGFVIAFALQNSLGNFASGILIMVFKPFDIGDLVEVGGVLGTVKSMNLLSVLVHTPDNKAVIIPNNNVWADAITNVTGTSTRRVDLVFGIGYDDDIEKAQAILEQVVSEHPLVLKDPAPVISVHELGDSSVNFVCRPWVKTADYWSVYWDLTRTVKKRFDEEGVSIPFPQRDVHLYNATPESPTTVFAMPAPPAGGETTSVKGNVSKGGDTEL